VAGDSEADRDARRKIQGTLVTALETAMRLLHPFIPFLTEKIWQKLPKPSDAPQSIMITLYPVRDVRFHDDASEASMALVQKIIVAVRNIRQQRGIPTATRLKVILAAGDDYKKTILEGYKGIISEHAKASEVRVRRSSASASGEYQIGQTAMAMAGDVEVVVPLEGIVDPGAEKAKLEKSLAKLAKDRDHLAKKLADPNFLNRAPPEVLEKDRARLAELESAIEKLLLALKQLK
jgi:valyl-tRNA synthetase